MGLRHGNARCCLRHVSVCPASVRFCSPPFLPGSALAISSPTSRSFPSSGNSATSSVKTRTRCNPKPVSTGCSSVRPAPVPDHRSLTRFPSGPSRTDRSVWLRVDEHGPPERPMDRTHDLRSDDRHSQCMFRSAFRDMNLTCSRPVRYLHGHNRLHDPSVWALLRLRDGWQRLRARLPCRHRRDVLRSPYVCPLPSLRVPVLTPSAVYSNLGKSHPLEWASTLLGCLSVLVTIPIYVFYFHGPAIRRRSKFALEIGAKHEVEIKHHVGQA